MNRFTQAQRASSANSKCCLQWSTCKNKNSVYVVTVWLSLSCAGILKFGKLLWTLLLAEAKQALVPLPVVPAGRGKRTNTGWYLCFSFSLSFNLIKGIHKLECRLVSTEILRSYSDFVVVNINVAAIETIHSYWKHSMFWMFFVMSKTTN